MVHKFYNHIITHEVSLRIFIIIINALRCARSWSFIWPHLKSYTYFFYLNIYVFIVSHLLGRFHLKNFHSIRPLQFQGRFILLKFLFKIGSCIYLSRITYLMILLSFLYYQRGAWLVKSSFSYDLRVYHFIFIMTFKNYWFIFFNFYRYIPI